MITVAGRSIRAVPLTVAAIALALIGIAVGDTLFTIPLVPATMPATWLVALAGANLFAVAVRPAWGPIALTLVRAPVLSAAQIAFATVISIAAYAPVALGGFHEPETTAWLILMSVAVLSVSIAPRIAWLPISLVGITMQVMNGLLSDSWYRGFVMHALAFRFACLVAVSVGFAVIAARTRTASWYAK